MKKRKILGALMFILGAIMLASSQSGITGNVISERVGAVNSIVALVLIVGGVVLFLAERKEKESGLVKKIRTKKFNRAIKKHSQKFIEDTISKIGTGLAKEEKLKGEKGYSIRVSGGGRIIFDYDKSHSIATLQDYLPAHEYDRL